MSISRTTEIKSSSVLSFDDAMKKGIAIVISVLFFASLCVAVLGCKKEEQKPAEVPKVEAPAAQPAPGAPGATEAPAK